MKKAYYYALIVLMVAGIYLYTNWKYGINENFFKEMLEERKQESYSGLIVKKYQDESGKYPKRKLTLKDNTVAEPGKNFWQEAAVGDSIVKIKGNDFVTLYKKDTILTYNYTEYINKLMKEELE